MAKNTGQTGTRRRVLRPNLKDYLRTGIVRTIETLEPVEPDELEVVAASVAPVTPEISGASEIAATPETETPVEVAVADVPEKGPETKAKRQPRTKAKKQAEPEAKAEAETPEKRTESAKNAKKSKSRAKKAVVANETSEPVAENAAPNEPAITESATPEVVSETVVNESPSELSASEPAAMVETVIETKVLNAEEIQEFLGTLAPDDRPMWEMMFSAATEVTREGLNIDALRDEFKNEFQSGRFTYYALAKSGGQLIPIQRLEQFNDLNNTLCVLRWDENGAARISN